MDAIVLVGGCDKTVPAQLMAAVSAGVPAVQVVAGPMLTGRWRGERLGACTDCRRYFGMSAQAPLWHAVRAACSAAAEHVTTMSREGYDCFGEDARCAAVTRKRCRAGGRRCRTATALRTSTSPSRRAPAAGPRPDRRSLRTARPNAGVGSRP